MSDVVIKVENLYKEYRLGGVSHGTLYRDLQSWWARMRGKEDPNSIISPIQSPVSNDSKNPHFLALSDVSFEVRQGEILGIIGRNGAGKSTLLKLISEVTSPTRGTVKIKGRLASLLEVGTGFHPELTGRENIYLNGAILGMSKKEITGKFDEIIEFAEVEKFIDTPVKRYSSGMYVRLAFAVAAHLEPEILIVDEVLAVGDAQFQKKCIGKMNEVSTEGKTILIVSHNMGVVRALCVKGLLLTRGKITRDGAISEVVDCYLQSGSPDGSQDGMVDWPDRQSAPGGDVVRLVSIHLLNEANAVRGIFDAEKPMRVEIRYEVFTRARGMRLVLQVLNADGIIAFTSTDQALREAETTPGLYRTICTIPGYFLNSGKYFIVVHCGCPGVGVFVQGEEFLSFWIEKSVHHGSFFSERWPGIVAPKLAWETQKDVFQEA